MRAARRRIPADLEPVPEPTSRRMLFGAVLAVIALVVGGCGGGDDENEAAGGTLPLFGGTVPAEGPAIDLTPSPSDRGGGREVVVIGDSITVAAAPQIVAGATGIDADVTVLAEVGRRITFGTQPPAGTDVLAEVLADGDPDLVVVALGTNDIGKYSTIEEYAAEVGELVDLLPDDQPLVWINTYQSRLPDESAGVQRRRAGDAQRHVARRRSGAGRRSPSGTACSATASTPATTARRSSPTSSSTRSRTGSVERQLIKKSITYSPPAPVVVTSTT